MPKQILSWQSKFNKSLKMYLFARFNIYHFSSKKEIVIIMKMKNFCRKNLAIYHNVKKLEIYFPYSTFVSYIC